MNIKHITWHVVNQHTTTAACFRGTCKKTPHQPTCMFLHDAGKDTTASFCDVSFVTPCPAPHVNVNDMKASLENHSEGRTVWCAQFCCMVFANDHVKKQDLAWKSVVCGRTFVLSPVASNKSHAIFCTFPPDLTSSSTCLFLHVHACCTCYIS